MSRRNLMPLLLAGLSFFLYKSSGDFDSHNSVGGPSAVTAMISALACYYARNIFSQLAERGFRLSQPQEIPPLVFAVLGYTLILMSFLPWLITHLK